MKKRKQSNEMKEYKVRVHLVSKSWCVILADDIEEAREMAPNLHDSMWDDEFESDDWVVDSIEEVKK
jgi:hypothetical protein